MNARADVNREGAEPSGVIPPKSSDFGSSTAEDCMLYPPGASYSAATLVSTLPMDPMRYWELYQLPRHRSRDFIAFYQSLAIMLHSPLLYPLQFLSNHELHAAFLLVSPASDRRRL